MAIASQLPVLNGSTVRGGAVLALDYGLRRVGVARSDPTGTLATPLATLCRRAGKRPPIARILQLAIENEAKAFVVGLPLDDDERRMIGVPKSARLGYVLRDAPVFQCYT